MAGKGAQVSGRWVFGSEVPEGCVELDSQDWFVWLAAETTTCFSYPLYNPQVGYVVGFMTVRKERRQRGSRYWVVYRRQGRQVRKAYLGRNEAVTSKQLERIGRRLQGKQEEGSD